MLPFSGLGGFRRFRTRRFLRFLNFFFRLCFGAEGFLDLVLDLVFETGLGLVFPACLDLTGGNRSDSRAAAAESSKVRDICSGDRPSLLSLFFSSAGGFTVGGFTVDGFTAGGPAGRGPIVLGFFLFRLTLITGIGGGSDGVDGFNPTGGGV